MKKIHTRRKRKMSVSSSFRHKFLFGHFEKKVRPKTFKTEEAAHAHAKERGIKKYELINLKSSESSTQKIRVEAKE